MLVFISWSGPRSMAVAAALHEWLPHVLQHLDPWMSSNDIDAGGRWGKEIAEKLEAAHFGICVVTPENLEKPWLNFEAGALAKRFTDAQGQAGKVVPYMFGYEKPEPPPSSPLAGFQAKLANQEGTKDVVRALNASSSTKLSRDRLEHAFTKEWPDLEAALARVPAAAPTTAFAPRADQLSEVHAWVQRIAKDVQAIRDRPVPMLASSVFYDSGPTGMLGESVQRRVPGPTVESIVIPTGLPGPAAEGRRRSFFEDADDEKEDGDGNRGPR